MKVNEREKFEKAVSPVIATILMVAITVVLSGVLYVWAANLAETNTDGDLNLYNFSVRDAPGSPSSGATDDLVIVTMDIGEEIGWATLTVKLSIDGAASSTCANPGSTTGVCIVTETSANDGGWQVGESVTISENSVDLCNSATCEITVTILDSREGTTLDTSTTTSEGDSSASSGGSTNGGNTGGNTGGSTGAPACTANEVSVTEAHADGDSAIDPSTGVLFDDDYIELYNSGATCSMDGVLMYDSSGMENDGTTFAIDLASGYTLFQKNDNAVKDGTDGLFGFGLGKGGDSVSLDFDADGTPEQTFVLPSYSDNGAAELCNGVIQPTGPGAETPGAANKCYATVAITEIANKGSSGICLFNDDGSMDGTADWVEIWNYGATDVDLSGFILHDDKGAGDSKAFGLSGTIAAGDYMLLCNDDSAQGALQFAFGIGGDDTVTLTDGTNEIWTSGALPEADCEADAACNPDDVYAMDGKGAWSYVPGAETPGAEN